ncbi:MAG TPA: hypothetical protein DDZ35_14305, partial [Halomonas sp.]|nr:hypothetical protein [Halomonas sp.]
MLIDKVVLENETIYGVDTDATSIPVNRLISAAQLQLYNLIDTAAGNARASFVSPGSYIDQ